MKHSLAEFLMLGAVAISATDAVAQAVTDRGSGGDELGEVIVTAQKRSEKLLDVPITITAATGPQLVSLGVASTRDLAKVTPGFTAAGGYGNSTTFTLRGVGFVDFTIGSLPSVGVYVDQAPLTFPIMANGTLFDLERVEVLKGPQGILFGQNSTAGAINYIVKKPTKAAEAGFRGSFGRFETGELEGYISGPVTDTLSMRFSMLGALSGPWQESYTRDDEIGRTRKLGARLQFQWEPGVNFRSLVTLESWIDRSEPQMTQIFGYNPQVPATVLPELLAVPFPRNPDNRTANWSPDPHQAFLGVTSIPEGQHWHHDDTFHHITVRADWDIAPSTTFTSLTSVARVKVNDLDDIEGSAFSLLTRLTYGSFKTFDQEFRLAGQQDRFNYVIGANAQIAPARENTLADTNDVSTRYFGPYTVNSSSQETNQEHRTFSAFGNVEWHVLDKLNFSTGVRYTHVKHILTDSCIKDVGDGALAGAFGWLSDQITGALGLPSRAATFLPGGCATIGPDFASYVGNLSFSEHNIAWRENLSWMPNDNTQFYGSVSRGYKSGSYLHTAAIFYDQLTQPVKQEQNTAYEVGFKALMLDRTVQMDAAAFYYDLVNKQLMGTFNNPFIGVIPLLANMPKSRAFGFDLALNWIPFAGLTLSAAGNYNDTKILSHLLLPNYMGTIGDVYGHSFNFAPRWSGVADAEYDWRSNGRTLFFGSSGLYNSVTNAELSSASVMRIKAYTTLDLRAGIRVIDDRWEARIWGRNVTNTTYWTAINTIGDTLSRYMGRPATYGVEFSYRF